MECKCPKEKILLSFLKFHLPSISFVWFVVWFFFSGRQGVIKWAVLASHELHAGRWEHVEKVFMLLFEKKCGQEFTILLPAHLALVSLHAPI